MPFVPSMPKHPKSSQRSVAKPRVAGILQQTDSNGTIISSKKIIAGRELVIGRDRTKCQFFIDDPCVSARHVRIHTITYDDNDSTDVDVLVYAEDVSKNGTYWNGSRIGRGRGSFLLSQDDVLKLPPNVQLVFKESRPPSTDSHFDHLQEGELKNFAKSYLVTDRLLGAGAFGKVFMTIEQTTRSQLACKVVDLRKLRPACSFGKKVDSLSTDNDSSRMLSKQVKQWGDKKKEDKLNDKLKTYFREVEILTSIRHPNIIGLEKVFVTENTIYLMQDLVTGGDLFSYIESKNGRLTELEAAVVIYQIAHAVAFLHEKNIVHRDLKPDNILMTRLSTGCRVVLTDFGAARRIAQPSSRMLSLAGTDEYSAPEVARDAKGKAGGYTKAVDLWSLGCVATVLLTGLPAFADPVSRLHSSELARLCNLDALKKSREWLALRTRPQHFVLNLLTLSEEDRMTAQQALNHEWFANDINRTDFEDLYKRSTKHWQYRPLRHDIVQFSDARSARRLAEAEGAVPVKRGRGTDGIRPGQVLEAHFKPFPRKMHQPIWPGRGDRLSPEVESALQDLWPQPANGSTILDIIPRSKRRRSLSSGKCRREATSQNRVPPLAKPDEIEDGIEHGHGVSAPSESDEPKDESPRPFDGMPPPKRPNLGRKVSFEATVALRPLDTNVYQMGDPIKSLSPRLTASKLIPLPPLIMIRNSSNNENAGLVEQNALPSHVDKKDFPQGDVQSITTPARFQSTVSLAAPRTNSRLRRRSLSMSPSTNLDSPPTARSRRRGSVFDFDTVNDNVPEAQETSLSQSPSMKRATVAQEDFTLPHHGSATLEMDDFA